MKTYRSMVFNVMKYKYYTHTTEITLSTSTVKSFTNIHVFVCSPSCSIKVMYLNTVICLRREHAGARRGFNLGKCVPGRSQNFFRLSSAQNCFPGDFVEMLFKPVYLKLSAIMDHFIRCLRTREPTS